MKICNKYYNQKIFSKQVYSKRQDLQRQKRL